MTVKYKCTIEAEMILPDSNPENVRHAKAAIDELIDTAIYEAVFAEIGKEGDTIKLTRELLEYVDEIADTTCSVECEEQTQDIVSDE